VIQSVIACIPSARLAGQIGPRLEDSPSELILEVNGL